MNIELKNIKLKDKNKFDKLLQLYLHDLALYYPAPFNYEILEYTYDNIEKYYDNDLSYFIVYDKNIVGFILLDNNLKDNYEISEIFILNQFKRMGIGQKVVNMILDMYKGSWTIKAVPNSTVAESFWLHTIKKYTNNNFKISRTGKYNRLELYFNNKEE